MTDFDYLGQRLEDQIGWYGKRSAAVKMRYQGARCAQILVASAIPVIALVEREATVVLGVLGAVTALISGLAALFHWDELWVRFRATAEMLKQEKFLFLSQSGPYGATPPANLAERCESIISSEHSVWTASNMGSRGAADISGKKVG